MPTGKLYALMTAEMSDWNLSTLTPGNLRLQVQCQPKQYLTQPKQRDPCTSARRQSPLWAVELQESRALAAPTSPLMSKRVECAALKCYSMAEVLDSHVLVALPATASPSLPIATSSQATVMPTAVPSESAELLTGEPIVCVESAMTCQWE